MKNPLALAFEFAVRAHEGQMREGTSAPYLTHPLTVASLVLQFGGTESQAQAALLHDTMIKGRVSMDEIRSSFGEGVAGVVDAFSDPPLPDSASWRDRKEAYLAKVSGAPLDALLVIACEEFHEVHETVHDYRYRGPEIWARFPVQRCEIFWYHREILKILYERLEARTNTPLLGEYSAALKELQKIALGSG